MSSQMPELHQLLVNGCDHLELGCGVDGGLLGLVCAYPKIKAVGVELDADILAEAQNNAIKLGEAVHSRVRWREMDAAKLKDAAAFDSIFWSQAFFPPSSQGEVIKAAFRALKPGGYLYAPAQAEIAGKDVQSVANQQYSLHRLVYSSWGMTGLSQPALQLELEAAGFELVRA